MKKKLIFKKLLALVLALVMMIPANVTVFAATDGVYPGSGTATDPYVIEVPDGKLSEADLFDILCDLFGTFTFTIGSGNNVDNNDTNEYTWTNTTTDYEVKKGVTIMGQTIAKSVGWVRFVAVSTGITINFKDDPQVSFNFAKGADEQLDTVKEDILSNVIDSIYVDDEKQTITVDDFSVKFEHWTITGNTFSELKDDNNAAMFGDDPENPTEKITIVYDDAVSEEIIITLVESRPTPTITQTGNTISVENETDLTTKWATLFSVTGLDGATVPAGNVTYTVTPVTTGTFPAEGATETYKVKISVTANEYSLDTTAEQAAYEYEVAVTNPRYSAKVTYADITDSENNVIATVDVKDTVGNDVTSGAEVAGGEYTVVVTPVGDYYVADLTLNGNATKASAESKTTVYTAKVTVPYGTTAINEVTIGADVRLTQIPLKATFENVTYNPVVGADAAFYTRIYDAVVDAANSSPAGIVYTAGMIVPVNGITSDANNQFIITWAADDIHPEVSETVTVYITEEKQPAVIDTSKVNASEIKLTDSTNYDQLKALVEEAAAAAGVTRPELASPLEYTMDANATVPVQGETKNISVTVTCPENDYYLAATPVTITVPVTGVVLPAKVNVSVPTGGSLTGFTFGENSTVSKGDYTITVAPPAGTNAAKYYVDEITVTHANVAGATDGVINGAQSTVNFEWTQSVIDGTGLALGVQPEYTINVTFDQRTISAVANGSIDYNFYYEVHDQAAEVKAGLLDGIINTSSDDGDVLNADNMTVSVYNNSFNVWYEIGVSGWDALGNLANETFNASYEDLKVVWAANGKYPEVSVEFGVNVDESRTRLKSVVTDDEEFVYTAESTADDVIARALILADLPTGAVVDTSKTVCTIPALTHTEARNATVKFFVTEDANYLASNDGDIVITIPVIAEKVPSELLDAVDANSTEGASGTVVFYDKDNGVIENTQGGTVKVKVTPAAGGSYVESITVTDATGTVEVTPVGYNTVDNIYEATFVADSNNTYTVTVKYGMRTLNVHDGSVAINGYYESKSDAKAFETLRKDVLVAAGLNDSTDYSVDVMIGGVATNIDEISGVEVGALAYAIASLPETRDFQITWKASADGKFPAVTEAIKITLTESRPASVIKQADAYKKVTLDTIPENFNGWYTVETADGNAITTGVTATLNPSILPAEGTVDAEGYTLDVVVAETADYSGSTASLQVLITNPQYDAQLNVTQPTGANIQVYSDAACQTLVDTSDLVPGGTYYVTVTPTAQGAYVTGLNETGLNVKNETWDANGNVYSCEIAVEYGATESKVYNVSATVGTRQINIKDGVPTVTYTDNEAVLLEGVYTATVAGSNPAGISYSNATVALKEGTTLTKNANNTFVITWAGNEMYPEVSAEVTVYISEARTEAEINVTNATVTDEELLVITAEEVADGSLKDTTKAAILNAISGIVVSTGAATPTLSVETWPSVPEQGESLPVTVKVDVADNDMYLANTAEFEVTIVGAVNDAAVTINTPENGTITLTADAAIAAADVVTTYEAGKYVVTLTPAANYFIDTLTVTLDGDAANAVTYTYEDFDENGQLTIDIIDGTGKALDYVPQYELTAAFIDPAITINDGTVNYYGQDAALLPAQVWGDVNPVTNPVDLTTGANIDADPTVTEQAVNDLTVYYLAREAATFKETVTVNLPIVGNQTFTVDVPVADQWLEISQEVPVGAGMPTQDDIQAMVDELLEKYPITDLLSMGTDELKALVKTEMAGVYEEYYRFYNAHSFGESENGFETVKAVYNSARFGAVESNEAQITLDDTRAVSEIKLYEDVAVTYGFTEADLTAKILDGVYANGVKVDGAEIQYITKVEGLNASEEAYTIKVYYAGNEFNKHATAETTIIVNKAPVDVKVDNRLIKYEENLTYDMPVSTTPAGVDTINFIVGLDVSDININDGSINGIMGEVQLMIPESMQDILTSVGIKDGVSMSVSELQDALLQAAEALGFINSENEVVQTLITMLDSLPTEAADVTIKIGGELPTDIGVYLVGAVSADGNYETNFGVGFVVITPDGRKAELDWKMEDDNRIITRTLLTTGAFDTSAYVTSVAEGSVEEAEAQIIEVFLGVDVDGNIKLETDQSKLNVGAYTEIAMIVNWGNTMYYSEPIARAFVVVAETLDVTFVDATGENNERLFTFDNTAKKMDVEVAYKDGGAVILNTATGYVADGYSLDGLKIYYVGAQTNVDPYLSTEPPVHAGAYTVTAVYTLRDADNMISHMGLNVGLMVIEPAESDTTVNNGYYKYEKGTGHAVTDLVKATSAVKGLTPDTTVISAGITTDGTFSENAWDAVVGTVNVDMPTWLDEVFQKYDIFEAGYENGITASTFLAYIEKVEEVLAELNIELDTITQLKETIAQMGDNVTLTFTDDIAYETVGAYLVVGVVTDSDHYPSVGAGIMVIYPDATEVDLKFVEEDWNDNYTFSWSYLQQMNMDASAYNKGTEEENAEAAALVEEIFLGITDDGNIVLTDDKADLDIGAYTQFAYIADLDSVMYYAKPISRAFVVVPDLAEITFVDVENNERQVVYNGKQQALEAVVTVNGTVVENPGEDLVITYAGIQNDAEIVLGTEAPVHAGKYLVTAAYTTQDDQGRNVAVGLATATLEILPADASVNVDSVTALEGEAYDLVIEASSDVENDTPDTLTMIAGVDMDGFATSGILALDGVVNVDLPAAIDEILVKIIPDAYENGIGTVTFFEKYDEMTAAVAEAGYDTAILDQLRANLEDLNAYSLTFDETEEAKPTATGVYVVVASVFDPDYNYAVDTAIITIAPKALVADLEYNVSIPGLSNIMPYELVDDFDFGAHVESYTSTDDSLTVEDIIVKDIIVGLTTDMTVFVGNSAEVPDELGVYEQIAYVEGGADHILAAPITRAFTVVASTANVEFYDENDNTTNWLRAYAYDGTPKTMPARLVEMSGNILGQIPNIWYVGVEGDATGYSSDAAPSQAGAYQVIGYYISEEENIYSVGLGAMHIVKADVIISAEPAEKYYGEADPEFTFEIEYSNELDLPANITEEQIISDLGITVTRVPGEEAGEYDLIVSYADNSNYGIVQAVDSVFTIKPAEVTVTVADAAKYYGDADPASFSYTAEATKGVIGADLADALLITRAAGEDVDTYAYDAVSTSGNYVVTLAEGTAFTIKPAEVEVTVDSGIVSKYYGQDDPAEYTYTTTAEHGAVLEDFAVAISREEGEDADTYAFAVTNNNDNYIVTMAAGSVFTIKPAEVTVTVADAFKYYGDADPAEYAYSASVMYGAAGADFDIEISREAGDDAGTYKYVLTNNNDNYVVTLAEGTAFTIKPAEIAVQVDDLMFTMAEIKALIAAGETPAYISTITAVSGVYSEADLATLGIEYACTYTDLHGEYDITATSTPAAGCNYVITEILSGKLIVTAGDYVCWNMQTGVYYDDLSDALSEAEDDNNPTETIQMLKDEVYEKDVWVKPGTTLDLNGYTLNAKYVVAHSGADVVDYLRTGLLKVPQKNIVLDTDNEMLPIWNPTKAGYEFSNYVIKAENNPLLGMTYDKENGTAKFNFVTYFNSNGIALLKDGSGDNDVSIIARLSWKVGDEVVTQDYVYGDELVSQVISANGGLRFVLTLKNYENLEDLTAVAVVTTKNGVKLCGNSYAVNAAE